MISETERRMLANKPIPHGCIGYDCEGKIIKEEDMVEVVVADKLRERDPHYSYCGVGKRGKVSHHFSFPIGWFVTVEFENGLTVGCVDYEVRLISTT